MRGEPGISVRGGAVPPKLLNEAALARDYGLIPLLSRMFFYEATE
jgi:hypothetical protein